MLLCGLVVQHLYCWTAPQQLAYNVTFYVGLATEIYLAYYYYEDITLLWHVDNFSFFSHVA